MIFQHTFQKQWHALAKKLGEGQKGYQHNITFCSWKFQFFQLCFQCFHAFKNLLLQLCYSAIIHRFSEIIGVGVTPAPIVSAIAQKDLKSNFGRPRQFQEQATSQKTELVWGRLYSKQPLKKIPSCSRFHQIQIPSRQNVKINLSSFGNIHLLLYLIIILMSSVQLYFHFVS